LALFLLILIFCAVLLFIFSNKLVDIKVIKNTDIDNSNLPGYNAEILSYNVPSKMTIGETYLVSITVKNLGDNSWTAFDKYFLGEVDNKFDFRPYRIRLPKSVHKGEIVDFKFQMKAPEKEGTYNQKFRMVREFVAWFGDTLDMNIEVTKDERYKSAYKIEKSLSDSVDYSAEIVDFSIPKRMVAGKTYPVYLSIRNNGNFLWNKLNNVFLGFSEDKMQFSSSIRIDSYEIQKNEIMDFKFQMTAPAKKGLYIQKFQMVRELVAWFGDIVSVPIEVVDSIGDENFNIIKDLTGNTDYAGEIVGFDFPREVIAGKVYLVSLFIKNTGTKTWISGDDYYLGSVDSKSNFGIDRIPMPKITYPGEIVCLNFPLVAPPEEGLYIEKLRMVQELIAWFGDTFEIQIDVKKNSEILSTQIDKFTLLLSRNDLKYFEDFSNASVEQAVKVDGLNDWRKAKLIFDNHAYDVKVKIHGDSMNHYDAKVKSYRIKLAKNEFINGSNEFSLIIFSDRSYIPVLFDNFLKKFNVYFLEQKLVFFSLNSKKYLPYYFRPAKDTDFVERNEFSSSYLITKPVVDHLFSVFISAEGHQSFLDYNLSRNEIKPVENVEKINYSLYLLRRLFLDKSRRLFDYFDREYLLNFEAITTLFLNTHDIVGDNLAMIYRSTNGKFVPMPSEEFMFIYRNLLVEVESNHVYCDRLSGYRLADFVKIFSYFNSDPGFRQEKYKKVFDAVKDDTYFNKAVVDFENSILAMMHEGIDYRQFGNPVHLAYLKHNMEFLKKELLSSKFLIFPKAMGSSKSVIKLNPISISEMKINNFKINFKNKFLPGQSVRIILKNKDREVVSFLKIASASSEIDIANLLDSSHFYLNLDEDFYPEINEFELTLDYPYNFINDFTLNVKNEISSLNLINNEDIFVVNDLNGYHVAIDKYFKYQDNKTDNMACTSRYDNDLKDFDKSLLIDNSKLQSLYKGLIDFIKSVDANFEDLKKRFLSAALTLQLYASPGVINVELNSAPSSNPDRNLDFFESLKKRIIYDLNFGKIFMNVFEKENSIDFVMLPISLSDIKIDRFIVNLKNQISSKLMVDVELRRFDGPVLYRKKYTFDNGVMDLTGFFNNLTFNSDLDKKLKVQRTEYDLHISTNFKGHIAIDSIDLGAINTVTGLKLSSDDVKYAVADANQYYDDEKYFSPVNTFDRYKVFNLNNGNLALSGNVFVSEDIIVPYNATLIIKPGTKIIMAPGVSILSYSRVIAEGTEALPIYIKAENPEQPFGVFAIVENGASGSSFKYFNIEHGNETYINGLYLSGMFSAYHTSDVVIDHSSFKFSHSDDGINLKYSNSKILNSYFYKNSADAIDFDFMSGEVVGNKFEENGNDSVDISGSTTLIKDNYMYKSGDKGVSVGENSKPLILNNLMDGCHIGIESKDSSYPIVVNNTIINGDIGINAYQKKEIFGSAGGEVWNTLIFGNKEQIVYQNIFKGEKLSTDYSEIFVKHSDVEGGFSGTGNVDVNPGENIFWLDDLGDFNVTMKYFPDYAGNGRVGILNKLN